MWNADHPFLQLNAKWRQRTQLCLALVYTSHVRSRGRMSFSEAGNSSLNKKHTLHKMEHIALLDLYWLEFEHIYRYSRYIVGPEKRLNQRLLCFTNKIRQPNKAYIMMKTTLALPGKVFFFNTPCMHFTIVGVCRTLVSWLWFP